MQRIGQVISLRSEAVTRCRELHAEVWPEVLAMIKAAHMPNYTIFLREPENVLFAYSTTWVRTSLPTWPRWPSQGL